jgi:ComF family protein
MAGCLTETHMTPVPGFAGATIRLRLGQLRQAAFDLLFPPICVHCRRPGRHLCPVCAQMVEPAGESICLRCGRRQSQSILACPACLQQIDAPLALVRAAAIYHGPMREAVILLKFKQKAELAPVMARYLTAAFALSPWPALRHTIDAVTPVPLHHERRSERNYNQAELLARAFCEQTQLPLQIDWLQRHRVTRSQVGLSAQERRINVADAFAAQEQVHGKIVLLIDDVYTTGATLQACALALRHAGAARVYALALAMPDYWDDHAATDV